MGGPGRGGLGSPFQLKPSLSGTYVSSLSHILTEGARFPGTVTHGMLCAPSTLNGESCGTRQYRSPAGRSGASSKTAERCCCAGKKPVVHGGGRLMFRLKLRYWPL